MSKVDFDKVLFSFYLQHIFVLYEWLNIPNHSFYIEWTWRICIWWFITNFNVIWVKWILLKFFTDLILSRFILCTIYIGLTWIIKLSKAFYSYWMYMRRICVLTSSLVLSFFVQDSFCGIWMNKHSKSFFLYWMNIIVCMWWLITSFNLIWVKWILLRFFTDLLLSLFILFTIYIGFIWMKKLSKSLYLYWMYMNRISVMIQKFVWYEWSWFLKVSVWTSSLVLSFFVQYSFCFIWMIKHSKSFFLYWMNMKIM